MRGKAPQLIDATWAAQSLATEHVAAEPRELSLSLTAAEVRRSHFAWAAALDQEAELARFAEGLRRIAAGVDLLLLPPLVGLHPKTLGRLAELTGAALGELVATTPSVPGLRLAQALEGQLAMSGCLRVRDEVVHLAHKEVVLARGGTLSFDAAVLAMGRFAVGALGLPGLEGLGSLGFRELGLTGGRGPQLCEDAGKGAPIPWLLVAGDALDDCDGLEFACRSGAIAGREAARAAQDEAEA